MRSGYWRGCHSGSPEATIALSCSGFNSMQLKHGDAETAVRSYDMPPTLRRRLQAPDRVGATTMATSHRSEARRSVLRRLRNLLRCTNLDVWQPLRCVRPGARTLGWKDRWWGRSMKPMIACIRRHCCKTAVDQPWVHPEFRRWRKERDCCNFRGYRTMAYSTPVWLCDSSGPISFMWPPMLSPS